tara:strand:- start:6116 stop:7495 length:1380 start_codon:yes stop_codon:yes gene_type:complete
MKASLQLKLHQQLTMTPQLQQAIRLLQLSSLELQQEIQQAVEANPLLDAEELYDTQVKEEATKDEHEEKSADSLWEWQKNSGSHSSVSQSDDVLVQNAVTESLQDYLLWQLDLTPFSEKDRTIAIYVIDSINEEGYLIQDIDDIFSMVDSRHITHDDVETVVKRIQHFDPIGVGSRTLQECLLVQLEQFPEKTPWLKEAKFLLSNHIKILMAKDFRLLTRKAKLKEEQLKLVMSLIQTLNPKPGLSHQYQDCQFVVPDVYMRRAAHGWKVELNPSSTPRININQKYASLVNTSLKKSDNQFIKNHLQEAKWFIKSLENRNDTLLRVAQCIVNFQVNFFELGEEAMKPMVLNDIAMSLEMHESTISRVTNQKYMHTPRGVYELKYFFSSHVSTASGGECSSTAIRALIRKLIAAENPKKPLSDNKIAQLLDAEGIRIARRTIAKYREAMMIQPSNQRKTL